MLRRTKYWSFLLNVLQIKKKKEKEKKEKNLGEDVAADKRLVIALECVLSTIEDDCSRMCSLYYRGRLL